MVMDEIEQSYDEDAREACKYGKKCYQRNTKHNARFKHPPKDHLALVVKPEAPVASLKRSRSSTDEETDELSSINPNVSKRRAENIENDKCESMVVVAETDLPVSPFDVRENIKQKFLVEMPDDFYSMWEFCKSLDHEHPEDAFSVAGLKLVGPFCVLAGNLTKATRPKLSEYLCHHRYYYDPPEFQTVAKGDDAAQYHIGYFRDSPDEVPAFVGFNEAAKGCVIRPLGDNLFAAINDVISGKLVKSEDDGLKKIQEMLQSWAKKNCFSLQKKTNKMIARDRMVVAKGFHGAGILVPYDKNTEIGYRPLPETDENLRKILKQIVMCESDTERDKKFATLQDIITLVQFANDECDYGMGYELSMALFCYGHPYFHRTIELLMPLAYTLLQRPVFSQILKAHLKNRVKGVVPAINKE